MFTGLAETLPKPQGNPRQAVLNRDDASYAYLDSVTSVSKLGYGFDPQAELRPEQVQYRPDGLEFIANGPGLRFPVYCNLEGEFNVSNCLAAIGATVLALGIDPAAAARGIAALQGVPGRMERLHLGQDFVAVVDFAHTPNALKRSLEAARQMAGRPRDRCIWLGQRARDRLKRRLMAEVSAELADITILTAEDPRTESLADILAAMAAGAESRGGVEGQSFWRIPDRGEAIRFAVSLARPGDVVIACGKGHEQSMCFGVTEYPWDDRTALRAALAEHLGIEGPDMPYLPTQDGDKRFNAKTPRRRVAWCLFAPCVALLIS
jgi:UDP-N-acetylmuramoyl-L-alanyl-D-glutamate--2,6-diaminopimelate ligase